ncbi:MAG: SurA N-terminal domain-containing protein [Caldimicrobium sp.]
MFDFLRKGATSLFAKIFLAVIVIVFVFWGIGYFGSSNKDIIAEINGEKINLKEFQEFYHYKYLQLKQALGDLSEEDLQKMKFKELVLQELIQMKFINQLAEELGLKVTKEEVQIAISQLPFFQGNGDFDIRKYQAFLRELGLSPKTFETLIKADLLQQKFQRLLLAPVLVSKDEVEEYGRYLKQKIYFLEAKLPLLACERAIKWSERDLESYFHAHRDRYVEEEKIKLIYYELPITGEVEISEEEVKNYYLQNLNRFKEPFKIKLKRIFIPGEGDLSSKKALEIKNQIKSLEDFSRYGVKEGEWFEENSLPHDLILLLKNAKKGDILGPVKVSQGYLILGIEEINPERVLKLDEVRNVLLSELKKEKLRENTIAKANELYTKIVAENGLKNWAEKNGVNLKETGYLTQEELAKFLFSRDLARNIFKHGKGEYFAPVEGKDVIYLFEIVDKKNKRNLSFEEAKSRVLEDYLKEKGKEYCEAKVRGFIDKVKTEGDFKTIGKEEGFLISEGSMVRKEAKEFLKNIGKMGLIEKPFWEKDGIKMFYITKIEEYKGLFSPEEYSSLQEEILSLKRDLILKNFLSLYQRKAKIKIYPLFQQI